MGRHVTAIDRIVNQSDGDQGVHVSLLCNRFRNASVRPMARQYSEPRATSDGPS
jgi:hypothetical protein